MYFKRLKFLWKIINVFFPPKKMCLARGVRGNNNGAETVRSPTSKTPMILPVEKTSVAVEIQPIV